MTGKADPPPSRPLRVLLTRAEEDAKRSASLLSTLGYQPLVVPLQTILPTGEAAPSGPFDAVIVTSANARSAMIAARPALVDTPILAVGARTARALGKAGFPDVRAAGGDAVSLAHLARQALPAGARLLHVAGRHRKAEPERSLRAAGFSVSVWAAYEARAAEALPVTLATALREVAIDAVIHYSRRSAEILIGLSRAADLEDALRQPWHVCLSDDVAAPLRALAAARVIVAAEPCEASLVRELQAAGAEISGRSMQP